MGVIVAGSSISTVRVPELPAVPDSPGISLEDLLIIFKTADNTTNQTTVAKLMAFFVSGGGGTTTTTTIQIGNRVIHIVTAAEDGTTQILIPQLAGVVYNMTRGSQPLIPGEEFEILTAGGVKLPQAKVDIGDTWHEGERLIFDIYDYGSTSTTINNGGFISDVYQINNNVTLSSGILGQLGQIRTAGNTAPITATLPSVGDSSGQGCVFFETDINNDFQTKIAASSGQKIYMNGASLDFVWMGVGEVLYLMKRPDGWYVLNNFGQIYREIGKVKASFINAGVNELPLAGQLVNRADYPRLFAFAQTLGSSYVNEATWNQANGVDGSGQNVLRPYKGCFSSGDLTTTFRLPEFGNSAIRGLKNQGAGSDSERYLNRPGGFQQNSLSEHGHSGVKGQSGQHSSSSSPVAGSTQLLVNNTPETALSTIIGSSVGDITGNLGMPETRMDNIGMFYVINV